MLIWKKKVGTGTHDHSVTVEYIRTFCMTSIPELLLKTHLQSGTVVGNCVNIQSVFLLPNNVYV